MTDMTPEQTQRITCLEAANKALRQGGASLVNNSTSPGTLHDLIDLTSFLATGEPYCVTRARDERFNFPAVQFLVGEGDATLHDLFSRLTDDQNKTPDEPETPDFD